MNIFISKIKILIYKDSVNMPKLTKNELEQQVILGAREYGISTVLFRHIIGDALGVNVTDMECLGILFHKGVATPSELAAHTGLSSGATTAMLNRLEKSKLIERKPNPDDRRGTLIVVVKETARKVAPLFRSVRAAQSELTSRYTKAELEILTSFFHDSTTMWEAERTKLRNALSNKNQS